MIARTGVRRRAVVDLDALCAAASAADPDLAGCVADVRADAYGHGLTPVARALGDLGLGGLLVSRPDDAVAVSDAGIAAPAAVLAPEGTRVLGPELYGLDPSRPSPAAMRLEGEVIAVKRVPSGRGVSYGYTYRTRAETTLALVALGYADGVLRAASNTAPVLVGGRQAVITGRIAMDQFVVDVGDEAPRVGDPVILFGAAHRGEPTALDWAAALRVPAPAITSRLGRRIERVYGA